jgi:hypothetical protein
LGEHPGEPAVLAAPDEDREGTVDEGGVAEGVDGVLRDVATVAGQ